jgi:hypothetical protein
MSHFWAGSFCRCYSVISVEHKDTPKLYFPTAVVVGAQMLSNVQGPRKQYPGQVMDALSIGIV